MVKFKVQTFTITASAGTGGTISPQGTSTVNYGAKPIYTITPNTGFVIDTIFVNGVKVDSISSYTFDSVKSNQIISVQFKVQTFTIIATAGIGGGISPQGTSTVNYGAKPIYTITPNIGFIVDTLFINGLKVDSNTSYTFDSVKSNQTISVKFKVQTFTITASAETGGTISPQGTSTVNYGSKPSYTISQNTGFLIDTLFVNGVKVDSISSYTFDSVKSDQTILVKFKQITQPSKPLNVLAIAGNGQAIVSFSKPINNGGVEISKYIVEVVGGSQKDSSINSPIIVTGLTNGQTYQFSVKAINSFGLISDTSLTDSVIPDNNLRIVRTSVINGSISNNISVLVGGSINITYTPEEGYILDSIYINGEYNNTITLDSINGYTFNNVGGDSSIIVKYKIKTYTITASAGMGGTISPQGISTVNYGAKPGYTILPNTGFVIDTLFVNGVKVDSISSYTFDSVKSNQTISVTFKVQTFTITASAETGGGISPLGVSTFSYGEKPIYTITPNIGFIV
ncbi:MAG: fibronectin type III domain-containing protein, partial [Sediminibacterium sp.]|nr:fibronectin type III domain-containing protein [Sediminibacterium sp.]